MSSNSDRLQAALFNLAASVQDAHNNAVYSESDKRRLLDAFGKITDRKVLVQLHRAFVEAQPVDTIAQIEDQCHTASDMLAEAVTRPERKAAIDAVFEMFPRVDTVLPEAALPFL